METTKITRTSKHSLKFSTKRKYEVLETLFTDFKLDLEFYIKLILENKLPLSKFTSSRELPTNIFEHSRWKTLVYKHASEIIRSQIQKSSERRFLRYKKVYTRLKDKNKCLWFINKKFNTLKLKNILESKYFTVPCIKNLGINIDERFLNYRTEGSMFNEFIQLKLPYFQEHKKRAINLNLPIKYHKHSNKFSSAKGYKRKNTLQLLKINDNFYVSFIYEKEIPVSTNEVLLETSLGIDIGYKKLITTSNNTFYGTRFEKVCNKIANKKRDSKNYKQCLTYRTNEINRICNSFIKEECQNLASLIVEDLKNVKKNTKKNKRLSSKFSNKLQYWSYKQVLGKFERFTQENGVLLCKVNPAYTSQTCSSCRNQDKQARQGEVYQCSKCNLVIDADYNASINILHRGIYSSSTTKNELRNKH